jgi:hypothetical protein
MNPSENLVALGAPGIEPRWSPGGRGRISRFNEFLGGPSRGKPLKRLAGSSLTSTWLKPGMCLAPMARCSYEPGATPQGSVRKNSISTKSAIHLHTWRLSIEPNASPDSRFQRWLGGKLFLGALPQAGMISALGAKQVRSEVLMKRPLRRRFLAPFVSDPFGKAANANVVIMKQTNFGD